LVTDACAVRRKGVRTKVAANPISAQSFVSPTVLGSVLWCWLLAAGIRGMTGIPQYARRRRHGKAGGHGCCRLSFLTFLVLCVVVGRVVWVFRGRGVRNADAWFSAGREDVLVRMEAGRERERLERWERAWLVEDYAGLESDYGDDDGDDADGDDADEDTGEDRDRDGAEQKHAHGTTGVVPQPIYPPPPPRPKHLHPACKIGILDPTPSLCNVTDVWPYDHPGRGMDGMSRTPHMHAPHAAGHWLVEAVRRTPGYYESNVDKADLVLVDTHCFEAMYAAAAGERARERVSLEISRVFVDAVTNTNAFVKSKGKKFVVVRPTLGAPPGSMLDSCAKLKSVFFVGSERGVFCDNDRERAWRGQSVLLPPVTAGYEAGYGAMGGRAWDQRDVHVYVRLPPYRDLPRSPNTIFLESLEARILGSWDVLRGFNASDSSRSVVVDTSGDVGNGGGSDHSAGVQSRHRSLELMGRSKYCAILAPGDRQSSVELGLAVRQGCIPVFLGPPFHAMPLAGQDRSLSIQYADFAVFVHVADHTKSMWAFDEVSLADGDLEPDADILGSPVEVPDVIDAIRYVWNLPEDITGELHDGVLSVRDLFSYETAGRGPADVALDGMCSYLTTMKMEEARKKQEREDKARREAEAGAEAEAEVKKAKAGNGG